MIKDDGFRDPVIPEVSVSDLFTQLDASADDGSGAVDVQAGLRRLTAWMTEVDSHEALPDSEQSETQCESAEDAVMFKILGRTSLRMDGRFAADWGRPRERAVLATLLLHSGKSISVDTVAEWVWPDGGPTSPHMVLQTYMSRIRATLNRSGIPAQLTYEERTYRLDIDRSLVDYFVFRNLAAQARNFVNEAGPDFAKVCALLERAVGLWNEKPLADLASGPAEDWRRVVVRDELRPAYNMLLDSYGRLGWYEQMLATLNKIQLEGDLDAMLARHRLRALYGLGRSAEAGNHYIGVRRRIQSELGDGTEEELQRFHEQLRAQYHQHIDVSGSQFAPRRMPLDIDDFVGHEEVLAQLDSLIDPVQPQLIALDGPPGVGKTTLAVNWAHRVLAKFPDGFWFTSLNGMSEGPRVEVSEVVKELLGEFGVAVDTVPSSQARMARLRELLANRRMLLVLDNVADADHIRPFLSVLSNCVVLVTSRARLSGLALSHSARCFSVEPLAEEEIAAWLNSRFGARAVSAPDAVARLAALADGMPLAMLLIGEQVANQSQRQIEEFESLLDRSSSVFSLGIKGIRSAFEFTYGQFSSMQAYMFRLFGLNPAREVPLEVLAAMARIRSEDAREHIDMLVRACFVGTVGDDRYRLHDLLREYAVERALQDETSDEREAVVVRMLGWYLHSVNNADRRVFGHREAIPLLSAPVGVTPRNFSDEVEVARWCLSEESTLVAVIQQSEHPDYVWRLAQVVGELFLRYGRHDALESVMTAGAAAAWSAGDKRAQVDTLNRLGHFVMTWRYDFGYANRLFRQAREVFGDKDDPEVLAVLLSNQAECLQGADNVAQALSLYEQALSLARCAGSADIEGGILHRMGVAHHLAGRLDDAARHVRQALHLREKIGDHNGQGDSCVELAQLAYEGGDHFKAVTLSHQAIRLYQGAHNVTGQAKAYLMLGLVNRDNRQLENAWRSASRAVDLCRGLDRLLEATALDLVAQISWIQGIRDVAITRWKEAIAAFRDIGDPRAKTISLHLKEISNLDRSAEAVMEARVPASRPTSSERSGG